MVGRLFPATAFLLGVVTLVGCNKPGQIAAGPQWNTAPKEGYLRIAVYGGDSNLENIALAKIPPSVPDSVFAERFQTELAHHQDLLPENSPAAHLALTEKVREAFRSVKQTKVETQTVQKTNAVAAYGLFEVSREEIKQAVDPAVRGLAKEKGWDQEKVIRAVNETITAIKSDG